MPSGAHCHYEESRAKNGWIKFWIGRTDSGPVNTRWPGGSACRTTRSIIDLGCRPASIGAQRLQPSAMVLGEYEEVHMVCDIPRGDLGYSSGGCSDKAKSSLKDCVHILMGLLAHRGRGWCRW